MHNIIDIILTTNNCSCMFTVLSIYVRTVVQPAETRGRRRIGGGGGRSLIFGFFFLQAHTRVSHIPRTHVDTLLRSLYRFTYITALLRVPRSQHTRIYKYTRYLAIFYFLSEKKIEIMDLTD